MIQFNSNTPDGLYCGSSDTCSAPATPTSPFSKVHLHLSSSPQRARVRCFSFFLPSPLHHTTEETMKQRLAGEDFTLVSFTGEGEKGHFLHVQNTLYQRLVGEDEGWRQELRTRWVRDAQGHVRSRVRRCGWGNRGVTWWAKERASFQKKRGGRRKKKGRFVRKSTIFHSISPDSQESKYFFIQNIWSFEIKSLLLCLKKHNFPSYRRTAASI